MDDQPENSARQDGSKHLNPKLRHRQARALESQDYLAGIRNGDRSLLSRAITLVESTHPAHRELAEQIIEACLQLPPADAIRIGITGSPGVGKSTFIDSFGRYLLEQGRRPAVLAIDPSSSISGGSILGDKTRMESLSRDPRVFIRPSPSGESLGGVAQRTRESILLCETAGFDTIIVETVGVGQSETTVRALVDFFLLLLQPGAGDELQGIKRGIVEMADLLAVNKSDGTAADGARATQRAYQNAVHLLAPQTSGWPVKVVRCSALQQEGLAEIWQLITDFRTFTQGNGFWLKNRREQSRHWLHHSLKDHLQQLFYQHPAVVREIPQLEEAVSSGRLSPFRAAQTLIRLFIEVNK